MNIFQKKDNDNPLKYKSWNDISISLYKKIVAITEDKELCEAEKDIAVIALLCGKEEQEIYDMEIGEVQELGKYIQYLNAFDFNKEKKHKKILVGNTKCRIDYNLQNFTYAQYVDFQGYWNVASYTDNLSKLLSVFIIPKGKKYNEGYDMVEFINEIENNVSIVTANEICFFFLMKLLHSTKVMLTCLRLMTKMKKAMPVEKRTELENKLLTMEKQLTTFIRG